MNKHFNKNRFSSSQKAELTCDAIDDNGKGIARYNGETLFIDDFLPGEKGEVELTSFKGKTVEAKVLKRFNSSPSRVVPKCPLYKECGGCSLMHLDYQAQLKYKQEKVKNLLHKFGKIEFNPDPTVGMDDPYRFRNKVQVPIKRVNGKIVSGFYQENTHSIVPVEDCLIETKQAEAILSGIKKLMADFRYDPYDEDRRTGLIRHILIKESFHYPEIMVVLVTAYNDFPGKKNFAKAIAELSPSIKTVVQNVNPNHTNVILGYRENLLYGPGHIKDSIFGLNFIISAQSFYQTNPIQTEKLYGLALTKADLKGDEEVLDAYSGTGTIGICASRKCKNVTCVEIVKEAVEDGIKNAKFNNADNVSFVKDDCTAYLTEHKNDKHFDVIFMDPPRKGSTPEFIEAVKNIKPQKVIYISCNPVTLARDLSYFKDAYDVVSVTPVDMFPQTAHVETIVGLILKN